MDTEPVVVGTVRGVVLAVWSWLVLAGLLTLYVISTVRPATVVTPTDGSRTLSSTAPPSALDVFGSIVTFQFGPSMTAPDQSAMAVVVGRAGPTLLLLAVALVFAALIAVPFVLLARTSESTGRRAAVAVGTGAGALPAFGVLSLLLALALGGLPLPTHWRGGLDVLIPALALALPLAGMGLRIVDHADRGGRWLPDGWMAAWWFLGAVVAVEYLFGVPGLGGTWYTSLIQQNATLFVPATVAFALPLLVGTVVREVVRQRRAESRDSPPVRAAEGPAATALPGTDRRAPTGALAVAGLLVVGVVGVLTYTPAPGPSTGGHSVSAVLAALGGVMLPAVAAVCVGAAVGVPLGALAARVESLAPAARGLFDPFRAVPPVVLLALGVVLFTARDSLVLASTVGPLVGLALAPLAVRATERELGERGRPLPDATVGAVGVLSSNAAVVVLAVAAAALLGLWGRAPSRVLAPGGAIASPVAFGAIVLVVTLPALAFTLLGRQLRG